MIAGFDLTRAAPFFRVRIATALEALTVANRRILDAAAYAGRPFPPLYASGIRYAREQRTGDEPEAWQTIDELHESRRGDCEDLACARAAELQREGVPAWPAYYSRPRPGGARLFHIIVLRPRDHIEDPSRVLGMGRE